ncbi:unnamed protein product [Closterium sp. NIES-65]|nr:unnamed protein product [Closterium sp. NIES-65]
MCELNDTVVEAQLRTLHMPPCCPLLIHSILSSPPFTPPPPSRFGSFPSELNDTVVEAQLRTLHIPPLLPVSQWLQRHTDSLGGATQATHAGPNQGDEGEREAEGCWEAGGGGCWYRERLGAREVRLHPIMLAALHWLSSDPANTIVIMSGSECAVLDEEFGRVKARDMLQQLWTGPISNTAVDMVQGHAAARHVEERETSLVWNYKYADVKLGRMQPRDMLQHLWTGPISNTAVDVVQLDSLACFPAHPLPLTPLLSWSVASQWSRLKSMFCRLAFFPSLAANPSQGGKSVEVRLVGGGKLVEGGKSVEVRPVGVSKGAAMEMVLREIVHQKSLPCPFDFVITVGHLISRDEDMYQLLKPDSNSIPLKPSALSPPRPSPPLFHSPPRQHDQDIYQFFEPDLLHDNNMPPGMDGYQQSMDGTPLPPFLSPLISPPTNRTRTYTSSLSQTCRTTTSTTCRLAWTVTSRAWMAPWIPWMVTAVYPWMVTW